MAALRVIVTVIYVLVSIALTVIVLMQEGKTEGLSGAISGAADTYWGKNKGRSMEGAMNRITRYLAVAFIVLSVVLNLKWW
ncbi:MAG: preprotein translocase subunit SecG [Lachnospiraceae bacterium]|nr:preprotein translocase subunit SecG [Lachnospiraceae bacterium]MBR6395531.1 preprotein translocase subunit SecG [Lachnospiraceae bacterium]MCR4778104.1 preprotein translocase subunit SecG [Lachnospiraceae bacterium]